MTITDGKRTVSITMQVWTGSQYTPDFSLDFFEAGGLPHDEENDCYRVPDVDYCVNQAEDWKNGTGDFYDPDADEFGEEAEKTVFVDEIG